VGSAAGALAAVDVADLACDERGIFEIDTRVTFSDPAGWEASVHLSLVLQRDGGSWEIRQYHVSQVMAEH